MEGLAATPTKKRGNPNFGKRNLDDSEQETTNPIDLGFEIDVDKTYVFETIKKSDIPRVENLGNKCRIYDVTEKRYRELRYVPVADSIYKEDQHESYDNYPDTPLAFYRNQILVKGSDRRLMEYMLNHDLYEHSPYRISNKPAFFTLVDKEVQEKIKAKRHETEMNALSAIKDMTIEDLKPIVRIIFGITEDSDLAIINAMNELIKQPKKGSEKQSNAEKVLDNLGNPKLVRKYNIQNALDNGIIVADTNKMQVRLSENNTFLCNLVRATSPNGILEELTAWSFTPDGEKVYNVIRKKV
jgi:hypothetical protein